MISWWRLVPIEYCFKIKSLVSIPTCAMSEVLLEPQSVIQNILKGFRILTHALFVCVYEIEKNGLVWRGLRFLHLNPSVAFTLWLHVLLTDTIYIWATHKGSRNCGGRMVTVLDFKLECCWFKTWYKPVFFLYLVFLIWNVIE